MQISPELAGAIVQTALQLSTPLVIAGLGGMFSERSGVVNIALEGMMLMGAWAAVAATFYANNPWIGVLAAIIAGGVLGLVHAIVCVKIKGNQIVSGAGIILFSAGFTAFMMWMIWGHKGQSDAVVPLPRIPLPFNMQLSPLVFVMFALVPISWYILFRTPFGLRLRAAGEDPSTLDTTGVNVENYRIYGTILSGCLAGLAGAQLSIGIISWFGNLMTNGRGFIALAALIFGNWNPLGVFLAGMFFGSLDGIQIALQAIPGVDIPVQFTQMIPYVCVIIALGIIRRSVPPKAIGVPYIKERQL